MKDNGLLDILEEFGSDTYELQDNFGNIVEIEIDWAGTGSGDWDDWTIKRAIVLYP